MSEKFVIHGGKSLQGSIDVRGAKNAAFPILAATLLTDEECLIENMPLIEDVFKMLEILQSMGAKISWIGERTLKIQTKDIDPLRINQKLILKLRGSVLFLGPLLSRFGKIKLAQPGGCIIGVRSIDTHLDAFLQLGAEISVGENYFTVSLKNPPKERSVILNEFSVTATENLMLYSSLIPNKIAIKNDDADYQVQELARFLQKIGVKISGAGTHHMMIEGKKKLKGAKHRLLPDPIEAGTFVLIAAATKGNVLLKNIDVRFLEFFLKRLKDFGVPLKIISKDSLKVEPWKTLKMDKIQSLPYPGMPSDLLSAFGVLATRSQGLTLLHDPLYEGRLKYLEELNKMGAKIIFCDPHRAVIEGPTQLYGRELNTTDLRGGAALIIAGLIAKGQTTVNNVYQIDRGYEKIEERLNGLGADIKRIEE